MTAARRCGKAGGGAPLAVILALAAAGPAFAGERIVTDWRTGLALHGFDPVAYFAEARPVLGLPQFELLREGTVWRFRNTGNRAAFAERAEVYTPQFGGYDPVAAAHGVGTPGNPDIWLIRKNRLYLFRSAANRAAFLAEVEAVLAAAKARWPKIASDLVP